MKYGIAVLVVLLALGVVIARPQTQLVTIADTPVELQVAKTGRSWQKGLAGQQLSLDAPTGMLFVFPATEQRVIWMKGMVSPIDILWVKDTTIVGVTKQVQTELGVSDDDLERYASPSPVNAVIELPAGFATAHGIAVGDQIHTE